MIIKPMSSATIAKAMRIVITGGPGAGKTTLTLMMERHNCRAFHDVATTLILEGRQAPVTHPGKDPTFPEMVLQGRIQQYHSAHPDKINVYDRGLPDGLAFSRYIQRKPSIMLIKASERLVYDLVFILPPWKEIYETNEYRTESYEQAENIFGYCQEVYHELHYQPVIVPKMSVEDRATFIFQHVGQYLQNQAT